MTCGESANDSRVQWKVQLFGEFVELFIFNGYTIFQEFPEFHAVSDGIFRLFTSEAQVKHAGTYFCIRINEHRTKKYGMMLTVLESDPVCGTNASTVDSSVVENDYLELRCKIRYVGGLHSRMEWQRSDGENLTANPNYSSQELLSVITQQMKAEDNSFNYTVATFFETPAHAVFSEDVIAASNKPEYNWIFSVNVLFGPRNVSITPKKMTYSAGDVLGCSAAGNPIPTFGWTEIGSAFYVDGPKLIVSETMSLKHESAYRCTAVNGVDGQGKLVFDVVIIGVPGTWLDKCSRGLDAFAYVGVGAAITGIMLTVIATLICRLFQRERNLKNPKAENIRSSSEVYEYVSSADIYRLPTTSTEEMHTRTSAYEEIADEVITRRIDSSTESEQEYNTISGRLQTQPVPAYTSINAAYEYVSYPEA